MLQDSDLRAFHTAFEASGSPEFSPQIPNIVLLDNKGLFVPEVRRLVCSLQVAAVLGDVPQREVSVAQIILKNLQGHRCAPLSNQKAWSQAISWGLAQPEVAEEIGTGMPSGYDRERIVGQACLRLRNQGYKIELGAYGPQIVEPSRRELLRRAESYVRLLGGFETAAQILSYLRAVNLYHDGLWLFGEVGLDLYHDKRPMLPVGWLFSLALRNFGIHGRARKPEIAWKSLVDLVTDFAAVHDCQRYSMFEDIDLHPSQFHRAVLTSTLWRELFSLPQMPPKSLLQVLEALVKLTNSDDEARLCLSLRDLVEEITKLVTWSADDRLTIHKSKDVEQSIPLLFRLTGGPTREVNAEYGDPIASEKRTQDSTLLFAYGKDKIITMPRAFLAHAACNFVFEYTWSKLGKRAESLIGDTLERTIADACKGKAPQVLSCKEYWIDQNRYEFDVATRDADRIVLIETKAKMLTNKSRSGDMFAFF